MARTGHWSELSNLRLSKKPSPARGSGARIAAMAPIRRTWIRVGVDRRSRRSRQIA